MVEQVLEKVENIRDTDGRFLPGHKESLGWRQRKSLKLKGKRPPILSKEQEVERRIKISQTTTGRPRFDLRKVTPEMEIGIEELYKNGTLICDIARLYNISWSTVREYVKPEYKERRLQHQSIRRQRNFEARIAKTSKILTDWERGWLSGLIDGEGTLYFSQSIKLNQNGVQRYLIKLQIANSCRELLEKAQHIVGTGSICNAYNAKGNRKPVYILYFTSYVMRWLLPQLDLIVKRRQKEVVLEALELFRQSACVIDATVQHKQLDELKGEMKILNHRGL